MKKQVNIALSKLQNKPPETVSKEVKLKKLPSKEFKIITFKKLSELQENSQLNTIRKMMHDKMGMSTKRKKL